MSKKQNGISKHVIGNNIKKTDESDKLFQCIINQNSSYFSIKEIMYSIYTDFIYEHIKDKTDIYLYGENVPRIGKSDISLIKKIFHLSTITASESHEYPKDFSLMGFSNEFGVVVYIRTGESSRIEYTYIIGNYDDVRKYRENVLNNMSVLPMQDDIDVKVFYTFNGTLSDTSLTISVPESFVSCLYPGIEEIHIFREYFKSNSPILVLSGIHGVGKSVLVKLLMKDYAHKHSMGKYRFVFAKDIDVINNDAFWYNIILFRTNIVVFDDFDKYLYSRESGNEFMSKLLSFSDGVVAVQKNTKIIITTNYSDIKYDAAFVRPGRLYDYIELKPLNRKQIGDVLAYYKIDNKKFRKALNMLNINDRDGLTLAEIFEAMNFIDSPLFSKRGFIKHRNSIKKDGIDVGF